MLCHLYYQLHVWLSTAGEWPVSNVQCISTPSGQGRQTPSCSKHSALSCKVWAVVTAGGRRGYKRADVHLTDMWGVHEWVGKKGVLVVCGWGLSTFSPGPKKTWNWPWFSRGNLGCHPQLRVGDLLIFFTSVDTGQLSSGGKSCPRSQNWCLHFCDKTFQCFLYIKLKVTSHMEHYTMLNDPLDSEHCLSRGQKLIKSLSTLCLPTQWWLGGYWNQVQTRPLTHHAYKNLVV